MISRPHQKGFCYFVVPSTYQLFVHLFRAELFLSRKLIRSEITKFKGQPGQAPVGLNY